MARYHEIDTAIWEELMQYPSIQKLLYIYLFSNPACRPSGLYKISMATIKHHTGAEKKDLKRLCGSLIEYDFETGEVWVRGKLKRVLSGLKNNENMQKSIEADIKGLTSGLLSRLFVKKYEGAFKPPSTSTSTSTFTSKKIGGSGERRNFDENPGKDRKRFESNGMPEDCREILRKKGLIKEKPKKQGEGK